MPFRGFLWQFKIPAREDVRQDLCFLGWLDALQLVKGPDTLEVLLERASLKKPGDSEPLQLQRILSLLVSEGISLVYRFSLCSSKRFFRDAASLFKIFL